jgi:methyl-accepting chemotaxis protein
MKFQMSNSKLGIAVKTAIVAGILVLLLQMANGGLFLWFQSNLVNLIFDEYVQKVEQTIDQQGQKQEQSLEEAIEIHANVLGNASATFIYNFDKTSLERMMDAYIQLPELKAVRMFDQDGKIFFAIWKDDNSKVHIKSDFPKDLNLDNTFKANADAFVKEENVGKVFVYFTDVLLKKQLESSKQNATDSITIFKSKVKQKSTQSIWIQAGVILIMVFVLVAILLLVMNIIVIKPLNALNAMVKDLVTGEGDLTKRLTLSTRDEIGALADWFNQFIGQMQELVGKIVSNSKTLNSSSGNMTQIADKMAVGVDGLSDQSKSVSGSARTMSDTMITIAQDSEEAALNVTMVASATEEMSATVDQIVQNSEKAKQVTDEAVENAKKITSHVETLGAAAHDISNVTEVIDNISKQTNLLALNATIEAARAGEAGKGFSVVANEIKELAQQTAASTNSIKEKVEGIQSSTQNTVTEIEQISQVIFEANKNVSVITTAVVEQSTAINEIAGNISQAAQGIDSVNQNVNQSSTTASEIAQALTEVDQSADMMSTNSSQVKENADGLLELSEQLNTMVSRFKI